MIMSDKIFMLDAGHGGMIGSVYAAAPNKMFRFPDGTYAYEGVLNRQLTRVLQEEVYYEDINIIDICATRLDMGLDERVDIVNRLYQQYPKAVLISTHNNASPKHNASGSEVWTSVGQTKSDFHASIYADCFKNKFPRIKFRSDTKDGDVDKESMFYTLKHTKCPAFLIEVLFFDYWSDFIKLREYTFQKEWAEAMVDYMKRAIKTEEIW